MKTQRRLRTEIQRRWRMGGYEWRVEVTRVGGPTMDQHQLRYFRTRDAARKWAKRVEAGRVDPWERDR